MSADEPPSTYTRSDRRTHVYVDDRERNSGVIEHLHARPDVDVTIHRLPVGDYLWDDYLLFERKTLVDLAQSIKEGRLFRQANRLADGAPHGVLILEGTARSLASSNMQRAAIQGALIHLALFMGLPILRAKGPAETARLMQYATNQYQSVRGGALPRRPSGKRPTGKRRVQLYLLQGLPGVGPQRAQQLIDTFGSVEAVLQADMDDLIAVNGIGSKTAETIRWAVEEPATRYEKVDHTSAALPLPRHPLKKEKPPAHTGGLSPFQT